MSLFDAFLRRLRGDRTGIARDRERGPVLEERDEEIEVGEEAEGEGADGGDAGDGGGNGGGNGNGGD